MITYQDYDVNEWGLITNPGKFGGQPAWVPYFYDIWNDGFAESEGGSLDGESGDDELPWAVINANVEPELFVLFPELRDDPVHTLVVDSQGFVYAVS